MEQKENKVYLLKYLRKGLVNNLDKNKENIDSTRGNIDINLRFQQKTVGSSELEVKDFNGQTIELLGPADVKGISSKSVCRVSPAESGDVRLNADYKPYIEFYEEDLPWRYTPFAPESLNFFPWMRLIAVEQDECTITFKNGVKIARIKLASKSRIADVFSTNEELAKNAHVQIDVDDTFNGILDEKLVNNLLNENPDCGLSRILCPSKLKVDTKYYILLIPTYEQGRLAALGQNVNGAKLNTLVCPQPNQELELPVYYKWKMTTHPKSGTFKDLADGLYLTPKEAYDEMDSNISVDISQSGLQNVTFEEEKVIDVPAALVMNEKPYEGLQDEGNEYRKKLQQHLELNPVFDENEAKQVNQEMDPWVVPPVYGARHLMTTRGQFKAGVDANVVNEVNLKLQNRIPAGMGSKVVKDNQESFVNRAWKKVEVVNALNQMLREYYQMNQVNERAKKKNVRSTKEYRGKLTKQNDGLITDAALRMLQTSGIYYNNVAPDTLLDEYTKLEEKDNGVLSAGITKNYLKELYDSDMWQKIVDSDFRYDKAYEMYNNNMAWDADEMGDVAFLRDIFETKMIGNTAVFVLKKNAENSLKVTPKSILTSEKWKNVYAVVTNKSDVQDMTNAYNMLKGLKECFETFNENRISKSSSLGKNIFTEMPSLITPYPINVINSNGPTFIVPDSCYEGLEINEVKIGLKPLAIEYYEKENSPQASYFYIVPKSYLDQNNPAYYLRNQGELMSLSVNGNGNYDIKNRPTDKENRALYSFDPVEEYMYKELTKAYTWMKDQNLFLMVNKPKKDKTYEYKEINPHFQMRVKSDNYQTSIKGKYAWLRWTKEDSITKKFFSYENNGDWVLNMPIYRSYIKQIMDNVAGLKSLITQPTDVFLSVSKNNCHVISASEFFAISLDKFAKDDEIHAEEGSELDKIVVAIKKVSECIETLNGNDENTLSKPSSATTAPSTLEPIDSDKLGRDRIDELIGKYGITEHNQLEGRLHDKFPVMIHPDYLDPTFFYLRELSVDYVLPAQGSLGKNSISCFYSNQAFEEAFLLGMNTEMGRELMWREYPTDQRGSYFRKFWDQTTLPTKEDLKNSYYDIEDIDKWDGKLGCNHKDGKLPMLVFAIKGDLMQTFPDTDVYLQEKTKIYSDEGKINAVMTSWLTSDTYLVGFSNIKKEDLGKYYLAFKQQPMSLQFSAKEEKNNNAYGVVKPQCYLMAAN